MTYDDVLYRFPSRNSLTAPIDAFATVTRVTCDRRVLILNSILKVYSIALRFRHISRQSPTKRIRNVESDENLQSELSQKFPKNCQLIRSTRPLSALCRVASNSEYAPTPRLGDFR